MIESCRLYTHSKYKPLLSQSSIHLGLIMTVAGVSGTKNDIGLSSPYVQKYFVFACLEDWDFFFRGFAVHSYYQVRNSILLEEKFYKRSQLIITLFLYSVHISFEQFSPLVFFCAAYIPLTKINWVFLS